MATQLATAYVQIIPSALGMGTAISRAITPAATTAGAKAGTLLSGSMANSMGSLSGKMGGYGGSAGASFASKFGVAAKAGIAAAAVALGKIISKSLTEGAALEQSIGGAEVIYKDSYSKIEGYANKAFKTAGVSANTYMEQATQFGASLLQSLGGDTSKAADVADLAIKDMSDNVNTFGTDAELVQYAYQGFAKQNYTMLDNLRLGYGGTKTEMERLLSDAEKISGVKYDISNLSDVYNAIHVIQEETGVTGKTAAEAATTFSGSFAAMKAAASNLFATLALGDEGTMDIQTAMTNLISTAATFLFDNAIPMIANVVMQIPSAVFAMLEGTSMSSITDYVSKMFTWLKDAILVKIPEMAVQGLKAIGSFVTGAIEGLPKLLDLATKFVNSLSTGMNGSMSKIVSTGAKVVVKLVVGILKNLPKIVVAATKLLLALAKYLYKGGKTMMKAGGQLVLKIASGLVKQVPSLVGKIPGIITKIVSAFKSLGSKMLSIGGDIVSGIWAGISSKVAWIKSQISGFVGNVKSFLKSMFKIGSPSKLMRDEIGIYLAEGIGVGFSDGMGYVKKEMEGAIPTSFKAKPEIEYDTILSKKSSAGYAYAGEYKNSTNYWNITVDGAQDPAAWAKKFLATAKRQALMGGI